MALIFLVVAAAVAVVAVAGGLTRGAPPPLPRKLWLIALSIVVQLAWLRWLSHLTAAEDLVWLLPASYVPLGAFVWFNRERRWVWLIGLGAMLNLAAMLSNGGAMPAPAELAVGSGPNAPMPREDVYLAPGNKNRVIPGGDAAIGLAFLADRILLTLPGGMQRLASIGDFIAFGGCGLGLAEGLGWRRRRTQPVAADLSLGEDNLAAQR